MAEAMLRPRSPLAGVQEHAGDGREPSVTIVEQAAGRTFAVLARRDAGASLVEQSQGLGVVLPSTPRRVVRRDHAVQWTGPGQWQVQSADDAHRRLLGVFASLPTLCSTVVLDDSRVVLAVGGPRARDALAKMLTIDLHPRVFRPGDAAVTVAGGISVFVSRREAEDVFDCAVPRSFALGFWDWLVDAAAAYGVGAARPAGEDTTNAAR